jgi:hypothetical protein
MYTGKERIVPIMIVELLKLVMDGGLEGNYGTMKRLTADRRRISGFLSELIGSLRVDHLIPLLLSWK